MIRINLLPVEEAQRALERRQGKNLATLVLAGAGIIFGLLHALQWYQLHSSQRELAALEEELRAVQGPWAEAKRLDEQKQELKEKLRVIGELEAKKVGPVRLLAGVSDATPDKLWLTEFADKGGTLKLSGLGVDEQTVADFMRRLAVSPLLRDVDLEETSQVNQDGAKLKKFVIRGQIDYSGSTTVKPTAQGTKSNRTVAEARQ
jgi:type IV pilus assembly protein PilN